jgi:hypothetical protein
MHPHFQDYRTFHAGATDFDVEQLNLKFLVEALLDPRLSSLTRYPQAPDLEASRCPEHIYRFLGLVSWFRAVKIILDGAVSLAPMM